MKHHFVVLRGLPGSGKSHLVRQIVQNGEFVEIDTHSADYFWVRPNGVYDFNPRLLGDAHDWCFDQTCKSILEAVQLVILDNTNIQYKEFRRYIKFASDWDYVVSLVEPNTDWRYNVEVCAASNTHGVPKETIERMAARWESNDKVLEAIRAEFGGLVNLEEFKL